MAFSLSSFISHIPLVGGAINGLINLASKLGQSLNFVGAAVDLTEEAIAEYNAIRDFKSNPSWKNRVISVPRALQNIQTLVEVPQMVFTALRDIAKKVKSLVPSAEGAAPEDVFSDVEGLEDLKGLLKKFGPKIDEGFGKVLGFAAVFVQAAQTLTDSINDLKTIVDSIKQVRMDIENLDGVFLPQNNKRKTLLLSTGQTVRIRVGKLHGETRP